MVSCLQEIDGFIGDAVHNTVFLSKSSGPTTAQQVLQWLGLSETCKRVPNGGIDKIEDS